jgi:hypothetical protein
MQDPVTQSGSDLGGEASGEMAKYGIECAQISQFLYGGYRYSKLQDAIAEAKRHPRSELSEPTRPA